MLKSIDPDIGDFTIRPDPDIGPIIRNYAERCPDFNSQKYGNPMSVASSQRQEMVLGVQT